MAASGSKSQWYPGFKAAVFALLACNTAYYLLGGTLTKAVDALAWLTLLALFALETGFDGAFGALHVGTGKTLICEALPIVMGAVRPMLIVPATECWSALAAPPTFS